LTGEEGFGRLSGALKQLASWKIFPMSAAGTRSWMLFRERVHYLSGFSEYRSEINRIDELTG
jgi:hypothetical protein